MSTSPNPRLRRRVELGIRIAAPVLDLTLAVGTLVSRAITRDGPEDIPAPPARAGAAAARALHPRPLGPRA
jgi:hypothetical protein